MGKWRARIGGMVVLVLMTGFAILAARLAYVLPESPLIETFGYLGVFVLTMCSSATLFLPAPAFGAIGVIGSILNPLLVGVVAGMGAATGEMTGYFAGRSGRMVLQGGEGGRVQRLRGWVERYGFWALFLLSAIPNPIFDMAGLTAGSVGYPIHRYWLAVACGKSLVYSLIATLGSGIIPRLG